MTAEDNSVSCVRRELEKLSNDQLAKMLKDDKLILKDLVLAECIVRIFSQLRMLEDERA